VYDIYASKGNMEEEHQLVDSRVDIVVDVNQENFQQDQDDFDTFDCKIPDDVHALFSTDMEEYNLIKEEIFFHH